MLKIAHVCVIALCQNPLTQGSPKNVLATSVLPCNNLQVFAFANFSYILQGGVGLFNPNLQLCLVITHHFFWNLSSTQSLFDSCDLLKFVSFYSLSEQPQQRTIPPYCLKSVCTANSFPSPYIFSSGGSGHVHRAVGTVD